MAYIDIQKRLGAGDSSFCIFLVMQGYKFAQQEAKISLVRLFQNFTFTLAPGMPRSPRTVTGFTTGPADGVPVIVHRRK